MSGLELKCTPYQSHVLPGESLMVRLVLSNAGAEPVELADPDSGMPRPLTFELRHPADGRPVYELSPADHMQALAGEDTLAPMPEVPLTLQPGAALTFDDDVCEHTTTAFVPGEYRLVVSYATEEGQVTAPAAAVEVQQPRAERLASLVCPLEQVICTAFDHLTGDDQVRLLAREPFSDSPNDGLFRGLLRFKRADRPQSLVLAAHAAGRLRGRWLAWLQGDHLGGARYWGTALCEQVPPTSLGLDPLLLAEPGFQLAGDEGLLLVAGQASGGGAYVTRVSLQGGQARHGAMVHLGPSLPGRLLARLAPREAGGRAHLVWSEPRDGGVRIYRRSYRSDGQPEDLAPVPLLERPVPLLALALDPLGDTDQAFVHALLGPEGEERSLSYFRLPLDGNQVRIEEWTLTAPGQPVDAWAIASHSAGGLPVLARCGTRLLIGRARDPVGWSELADHLLRATHLQLLALHSGQLWAGWVDHRVGPCYLPL
jgi:hypothetical protein